MNLNKYDVFEVLKNKLTLEDVLILNWFEKNIKSGRLNKQLGTSGSYYYICTAAIIKNEIPDIACVPDNVLRKCKSLADKGYLDIINGKWMDNNFGYCRTAYRLTKKYKHLLVDSDSYKENDEDIEIQ